MKVLVIQQRYGIGDMLIFLPYLKALAEKNNVKISLLAKKTARSSELFKAENFLDPEFLFEIWLLRLATDAGRRPWT